jgi:quercetin 2,3-dioxygenase
LSRHFTDDEKKDQWVKVVAPVGAEGVIDQREASGPAPVQSPLTLFATLISPSTTLTHTFLDGQRKARKGYIHVVQTSGYNTKAATGAHVRVSGDNGVELELKEGDGAYIFAEPGKELTVENIGDKVSEVLLFDLE